MNSLNFLLDVIKYILSGSALFLGAYYFLESQGFWKTGQQSKEAARAHVLPLKLQAYERLVLFIERINPASLLLRLHQPGLSSQELHLLALAEIRSEFLHNITQQLYIGPHAWQAVKKIKEDTLYLLSSAAASLPADSSSADLSKVIINHLATLEQDPYDAALTILKKEMETNF